MFATAIFPRDFIQKLKLTANTVRFGAAIIVFVLSTIVVVSTMVTVAWIHSPLPLRDQWETVAELQRYHAGQFGLRELLRQHNEHRIVFPRLFFLMDSLWFGGTNRLLISSIAVIQILHGLLLFFVILRGRVMGRPYQMFWLSVFLAGVSSMVQVDNLTWGFQVQFVLVFFMASCAFSALGLAAHAARRGGKRLGAVEAGWLALSALAAFVSNYSMANGILVFPLLVVTGIWLRLRWGATIFLLVAGCGSVSLYLWEYHSHPGHGAPLESVLKPWAALAYTARYIGGVFDVGGLAGALAIGALGLAAAGGLGISLLGGRRGAHPLGRLFPAPAHWSQATLGAVLAFITGTALVTALGRINFPPAQVLSSRYTTPAILFWITLLGLAWIMAVGRPQQTRVWLGPAATLGAVLMLFNLYGQQGAIVARELQYSWPRKLAAVSILTGVYDEGAQRAVYPWPEGLRERITFLRKRRYSVFSDDRSLLLLRSRIAEDYIPAAADRCLGRLEVVRPLRNSGLVTEVKVRGWAWDQTSHSAPDKVLISDASGQVRGLAFSGDARPDIQKQKRTIDSLRTGWMGYARLPAGAVPRAYGVLDDGTTLCLLETELP